MIGVVHFGHPNRFFPELLESLGLLMEETDDRYGTGEQIGHRLLNLVHQAPKLDLAPKTSTAYLAWLLDRLRLGVKAEQEGLWHRADFYWRELRDHLGRNDWAWGQWLRSQSDESETDLPSSGEALRQAFVTEVLIQAHAAFFNGRAHQEEPDPLSDRAFAHLEHIEQLFALSDLNTEEEITAIRPALVARLNGWVQKQHWHPASQEIQRLRKRYPDDFNLQEHQLGLILAQTYSELSSASEDPTLAASILRRGLGQLAALGRDHQSHLDVWKARGHFHHLLAVQLGNQGELAEALIEVEKALIFEPGDQEAKASREALRQAMDQLRVEIRKAQALLAQSPNSVLSEDGQKLFRQVDLDERRVKPFSTSTEAKKLREQRAQTLKLYRCRQAGLKHTNPDDEQVNALSEAIDAVLDYPPKQAKGVARKWQRVAAKHPPLEAIDHEKVIAYLRSELFGLESEEKPTKLVELTLLESPERKSSPDFEPFLPWMSSRQHLTTKFTALAAILLLVVAGIALLRENGRRAKREAIYEQLQAAAELGRLEDVITQADQFLALASPEMNPHRVERAQELKKRAKTWQKRLRDEAFQDLSPASPGTPMIAQRDHWFQTLQQALEDQDHLQALTSIEHYLSVPAIAVDDRREAEVRRIYEHVFYQWILSTALGQNADAHRLRREKFQLLNAT